MKPRLKIKRLACGNPNAPGATAALPHVSRRVADKIIPHYPQPLRWKKKEIEWRRREGGRGGDHGSPSLPV